MARDAGLHHLTPMAVATLFPGGVGNTGKDPVRFASLIDDVSTKIFDRLNDEVWFYPGHGKNSTLGLHCRKWRACGWWLADAGLPRPGSPASSRLVVQRAGDDRLRP
jgi:glyoxylase-like metal-dependent hydrolase (beta-lactamase superfamily II)